MHGADLPLVTHLIRTLADNGTEAYEFQRATTMTVIEVALYPCSMLSSLRQFLFQHSPSLPSPSAFIVFSPHCIGIEGIIKISKHLEDARATCANQGEEGVGIQT